MNITRWFLAVLMALTGPAFAQVPQQPDGATGAGVPEAVPSVVVSARRFHVEPQDFADYEFDYTLSNGEMVRFSRRVGRFYVAIKGYERVEILASGPAQFVTKAGVHLKFTERGDALAVDNYKLLEQESGPPIVYAFGPSQPTRSQGR
jgi:hypothetical protein